jgi:regulator of sigma E protease
MQVPVTLAENVIKDQFGNESRIGMLGIAGGKLELRKVGPISAVGHGFTESIGIMKMMAIGLKQIVTGERSVKEMGGPVKIAKYSGEMMALGWLSFVEFAALISINLAFINLLPIPTLDGGHLAMYAAEAVRRKPLGVRSQEWAFRGGMALVLGVAVFVTFNDLVSLFAS